MAKEKDHIIISEEYQRYLNGQMTSRERHYFEKYLLDNDFERQAFEGLSQLSSGEIAEELSALKIKLADKARKQGSMNYWKVAASLLFLGLFSFIVYFLINSGAILDATQKENVASEVEEESIENTSSDTSILEEDRIVAYQNDLTKAKKSSLELIPKLDVQEPILEKPSIAQSIETEDTDEILNEKEISVSNDLPTLALVDDAQIDDQPFQQENKKLSKKALAPAATLSMDASARQSVRVDNNSNIRTITGVVVSVEDDEVIPAANINVKGTNIETISGTNGKYTIDVPTGEDVILVFSYVGFITQEIMSTDQDEKIDVKIIPDITALSEIVVAENDASSKLKRENSNFSPPIPVGGMEKFNDYVKENIRYPESGLEGKVKGTVKLKFTVEQNGNISNMEVLKSLGEEFDKEAIRLVNEGPEWKQETEDDSNVPKEVKVKIRFRVPD